MDTVNNTFECPGEYNGKDVYGLELEIEDMHAILENGLTCKGWTTTPDGSLRNSGIEFLTRPPIELKEIEPALVRLFKELKISENSYSDRTSIHVHCNMQGESMDVLKSVCLLYLVTEQVFFSFVEQERFENVFCVPLMDFAAPFNLFAVLNQGTLTRNWTKYSALNLLPLTELGTVEFRHMHGTNDVDKIVTWVTAIDCLKQAARRKTFDEWRKQISALNTTSEYGGFLLELFGSIEEKFLGKIKTFDVYKEMLYNSVMRAKVWEYQELKSAATPKPVVKAKTKSREQIQQWVDMVGIDLARNEAPRAGTITNNVFIRPAAPAPAPLPEPVTIPPYSSLLRDAFGDLIGWYSAARPTPRGFTYAQAVFLQHLLALGIATETNYAGYTAQVTY